MAVPNIQICTNRYLVSHKCGRSPHSNKFSFWLIGYNLFTWSFPEKLPAGKIHAECSLQKSLPKTVKGKKMMNAFDVTDVFSICMIVFEKKEKNSLRDQFWNWTIFRSGFFDRQCQFEIMILCLVRSGSIGHKRYLLLDIDAFWSRIIFSPKNPFEKLPKFRISLFKVRNFQSSLLLFRFKHFKYITISVTNLFFEIKYFFKISFGFQNFRIIGGDFGFFAFFSA